MSKKAFMAAIIILAYLVSLVSGMQAVKVARANPIPWCFNPQMTVTIQSPVSGANCALPLLVSFTAQGDWQFSVSDNVTQDYLRSFFYVLDGQDMRHSGLRFAGTKTTEIYGDPVYSYNFSGQANLTDITDGLHSITVYYGAVNSAALIGSPSKNIVYNPSWQATSQFYVKIETPTPSPTPTPAPTNTLSISPSNSPTQEPTLNHSPKSRVLKNFIGTMDSYFFYGGIYAYTFNLSMSVETESNGEWVVGNSYQITWQISIVNFSPEAIQEPSNLSLTFHDPFVGSISGTQRTIFRQTPVTIGQDGFLKVEFTPDKPVNQADVQTTLLRDQNYSSQEQFKNAHWDQNFDIWMNIVDSLVTLPPVTASPIPSSSVPEFSTWIILPLAMISVLLAVLVSKRIRKF